MENILKNISAKLSEIGSDVHIVQENSSEGTFYFYLDKMFQLLFALAFCAGARKVYKKFYGRVNLSNIVRRSNRDDIEYQSLIEDS